MTLFKSGWRTMAVLAAVIGLVWSGGVDAAITISAGNTGSGVVYVGTTNDSVKVRVNPASGGVGAWKYGDKIRTAAEKGLAAAADSAFGFLLTDSLLLRPDSIGFGISAAASKDSNSFWIIARSQDGTSTSIGRQSINGQMRVGSGDNGTVTLRVEVVDTIINWSPRRNAGGTTSIEGSGFDVGYGLALDSIVLGGTAGPYSTVGAVASFTNPGTSAIRYAQTMTYNWYLDSTGTVDKKTAFDKSKMGAVSSNGTKSLVINSGNAWKPGTYWVYGEAKGTGSVRGDSIVAGPVRIVVKPKQSLFNMPDADQKEYTGKRIRITTPSLNPIDPALVATPATASGYGRVQYQYFKVNGASVGDTVLVNQATITGTGSGSTLKFDQPDSIGVKDVGTYLVKANLVESKSATAEPAQTILKITPRPLASSTIAVEQGAASAVYGGPTTARTTTIRVIDKGRGANDPDTLALGTDFGHKVSGETKNDSLFTNNFLVGTATITLVGRGNYTGTVLRTMAITKRDVTLSSLTKVKSRDYDGTKTISEDSVIVQFTPMLGTDSIKKEGYTMANLVMTSANVAQNTISATVALTADSVASNYNLTSGALSLTDYAFIKARAFYPKGNDSTGGKLWIRDMDSLKTSEKALYYTGNTREFKSRIRFNPKYDAQPTGSDFDVRFVYTGSDGTTGKIANGTLPADSVKYEVQVKLSNNSNFTTTGWEMLDSIEIQKPMKPTLTTPLAANQEVRKSNKAKILAVAVSPSSVQRLSGVKYVWQRKNFRATNPWVDIKTGTGSDSSYTFDATAANVLYDSTYYFRVHVINQPGADVQVPDTTISETAIKITEPGRNLGLATITLSDDAFVYDGTDKTPTITSVTWGTDALTTENYSAAITLNRNAGEGLVTLTGIDGLYYDYAVKTFPIAKKQITIDDLSFTPTVIYNGAAQPLTVAAAAPMTGLGTVAVTYDGGATVPINAGEYAVKATITETPSANFKSDTTFDLGTYTVVRATPKLADLVFTKWPDSVALGKATGIGAVTLPGTAYGTITVTYDGVETVPKEVGVFSVRALVSGGANYFPADIALGSYKIVEAVKVADVKGGPVSKPGAVGTVTLPPGKVKAEFVVTVGPSPVSQGGTVKFFSTHAVKSGSLYVFDASGSAVKKLTQVKGKAGEVFAEWDLKDKRGSVVSEGTYVVKGSVATEKSREKVKNVRFAVVR